MDNGVDAVGRKRAVDKTRERVHAEAQKIGQALSDHIKGEVKGQKHDAEKGGNRRIAAGEELVDAHRARVLAAFVAFDDRGVDHALDEAVAHIGEGRVAVKPRLRFHLHDAVLKQLLLVFVELQAVGKIVPALDELDGAEARGHADAVGMVGDDVHDRVDAAVHRRIVCAEVRHRGHRFAARGGERLVEQLAYALAPGGGDGHDGDAERCAHFLYVDRAAVGAHLVHHVERQHHRHAQLEELEREVEVALDVGRVHDVDDAVGLFIQDEVARDDLLLRVGAQRIDARKVDHRAVLFPADLAHLLVDGHAREVADVLVGAGEGIEKRRFAAVLVADECKDHFSSPSTSIFLASSTRSVSS